MPRGDIQRLKDILKAIASIERYKGKSTRQEFGIDKMQLDAILLNIAIIGEAMAALSDDVKKEAPHIPWAAIKRMRNIIIHAYFGVSLDIVWQTISEDLHPLQGQIEEILQASTNVNDEDK